MAAVWGDAGGCTIVTANSRGFTGCSRTGEGDYTLTVSAGVSTANTFPICSRAGNGGFNTVYQFSCDVDLTSATTVRLRLTRVPENATTGTETFDSSAALPTVIVIP